MHPASATSIDTVTPLHVRKSMFLRCQVLPSVASNQFLQSQLRFRQAPPRFHLLLNMSIKSA